MLERVLSEALGETQQLRVAESQAPPSQCSQVIGLALAVGITSLRGTESADSAGLPGRWAHIEATKGGLHSLALLAPRFGALLLGYALRLSSAMFCEEHSVDGCWSVDHVIHLIAGATCNP